MAIGCCTGGTYRKWAPEAALAGAEGLGDSSSLERQGSGSHYNRIRITPPELDGTYGYPAIAPVIGQHANVAGPDIGAEDGISPVIDHCAAGPDRGPARLIR